MEGSGRGEGQDGGRGRRRGEEVELLEVELSKLKVPEGQLLYVTIKVLQQYYGKAIRENTGHLDRMRTHAGPCFITPS